MVIDVDKRLKVPYYEMPYIEREATATRCHMRLQTKRNESKMQKETVLLSIQKKETKFCQEMLSFRFFFFFQDLPTF